MAITLKQRERLDRLKKMMQAGVLFTTPKSIKGLSTSREIFGTALIGDGFNPTDGSQVVLVRMNDLCMALKPGRSNRFTVCKLFLD